MYLVDYSGETVDNKYRLIRLLGRGGMGSVYLGQHMAIGKKVAVKFLNIELAGKEDVVARFYREAQAAASIGHRNIIDVSDVGVFKSGEPYLVMEYLEGESLAEMISRTGPLDLDAACAVLEPALLALDAAHRKGIVHRDLKPENIFLVSLPGQSLVIKLIDFGVAKFLRDAGENTQLTQSGAIIGTPAYMSPEQLEMSGEVDARTDVYSAGVILYEMLTGGMPFESENLSGLLVKIATDPPRAPEELRADFPEKARRVVMRALEKDPDDRYQSAAEMLADLLMVASPDVFAGRRSSIPPGIRRNSYAGGDLGDEILQDSETSVASRMLAQIVQKQTQSSWSTSEPPSKKRIARKWPWVVGAIGIVLVAAVAIFRPFSSREMSRLPVTSMPDAIPLSQLGHPDSETEGVLITVTGHPKGAQIFFNEIPVHVNPFRVKSASTIVSLKVEAYGFESFVTSVIPSENRVVAVKMKQLLSKTSGEKKTKKKKKTKDEATNTVDSNADSADKYVKGKGKTRFTNDFE